MAWLTDIESRAWVGLIASVTGLDRALDRQLHQDAGISHSTYAVLVALSDTASGPRHMSDLAGLAGYSQSRLSHAVARLEQNGMLRREVCPEDGRAVHAVLTDRGQDVVDRAAPGHVDAVRRMVFDRLTPEQTAALADITQAIYSGLVTSGDAPAFPGPATGA